MKTISFKVDDEIYDKFRFSCRYFELCMSEELRKLINISVDVFREVYADNEDFVRCLDDKNYRYLRNLD